MRKQSVVIPFLYKAEDGIRDGPVTGVQTFALPIFFRDPGLRSISSTPSCSCPSRSRRSPGSRKTVPAALEALLPRPSSRSEERRVGEVCYDRRGPHAVEITVLARRFLVSFETSVSV